MDSFMANTAAAIAALVLMLAAVVTWNAAIGGKNETSGMLTGVALMATGAIAAFMIGRF